MWVKISFFLRISANLFSLNFQLRYLKNLKYFELGKKLRKIEISFVKFIIFFILPILWTILQKIRNYIKLCQNFSVSCIKFYFKKSKYYLNFTFKSWTDLKKLNFHVNVKEEPDIHTTNATFSIFLKQTHGNTDTNNLLRPCVYNFFVTPEWCLVLRAVGPGVSSLRSDYARRFLWAEARYQVSGAWRGMKRKADLVFLRTRL